MRLNERLNLVLEIERTDGATIFAHSTPISREVWQAHFLVLTKTVTSMYAQGFGPGMCMRVAGLMLQEAATDLGKWDSAGGVQSTLLPEIRRLTNVIIPTPQGYATMPLEGAVARGDIDADDEAEVMSAVVFFSAASYVHRRQELADLIYPFVQTTSLNSTAFAVSLQTSKPAANSGATAAASSGSA